jgi:hypothetical protein
MSWREWCESNHFRLDELTHNTRFELTSDANILHLRDANQLREFTRKYSVVMWKVLREISWARVSEDYDGIIIAPYCWEMRLDLDSRWYLWLGLCVRLYLEFESRAAGRNRGCLSAYAYRPYLDLRIRKWIGPTAGAPRGITLYTPGRDTER